MLNEVLEYLDKTKGKWPKIIKDTELKYDWITKLAQGRIPDPSVRKIQILFDYMKQNPPFC